MSLPRVGNAVLVLAIVLALGAPGAPPAANAASVPLDAQKTVGVALPARLAPATPGALQQPAGAASWPTKPGGALNRATPRVMGETDPRGATPAVYIVQLTGAPLASYRGSMAGMAPTSPSVTGASLATADAASAAYLAHLGSEQAAALAAIEQELGRPVAVKFTYAVAFNGFALVLTPGEAQRVASLGGVQRVERDFLAYPQTDDGPNWIGAPALWTDPVAPTFGAGVVVGVIDTGINFGSASFARVGADGYIHTNPRGKFYGVCDPTGLVYNPAFVCNEKLIGGWDFVDNSSSGTTNEFDGPEDNDGHGSHTASTAAGNFVNASLVAPTLVISGSIKGVAPHANLIAYDVCLADGGGCPGSALVAGINQAVADDVDVINFSIGGSSASPWARSDALAFLAALDAGVFVAVAAGNSGPAPSTMASPANAPWVTAVGASTHDRRYDNNLGGLSGGDTAPPADIAGQSITRPFGPAPIVDAGDYISTMGEPDPLCLQPFTAGVFAGEIVVCEVGVNARVAKGANVLAGGAGGMVLVNTAARGDTLRSETHVLPAVHVSYADGVLLKTWLSSGEGHTGAIAGTTQQVNPAFGDILASFSARGPDASLSTVIKPDVAAPGLNIFAAYRQPEQFNVISGTSMASPHVAGAAALLVARHPDWSPSAIRSALMMSGILAVQKEDGVTLADVFDIGGGRVDLARADAVGFVLDESAYRFEIADPAKGGDPSTLNLASLAQNTCVGTCTWTRTLRSVRDAAESYAVTTESPLSMTLTVTPNNFTLPPFGTQVVTITADVSLAAAGAWVQGAVSFGATGSNTVALGAHPLHFPLAVMAHAGSAPDGLSAIAIDTRRNSGLTRVAGLRAITSPTLVKTLYLGASEPITGVVAEDPTNDDPYDIENGGVYTTLVPISDPTTAAMIVRIVQSTAIDLDLFVGIDVNGDGIPSRDEQLCSSTMGSYLELCEINQPIMGVYWILVQNWIGSGAPLDTFVMDVTRLARTGGPAGNFYVTGPDSTTAGVPFGVQLHWDYPDFMEGDVKPALLELGTSADTPDNIAVLPVTLTRLSDEVTLTAATPAPGNAYAQPGDLVTFTLDLEPEPAAVGPVAYTITATLPAGLGYVPGTAALSSSLERRQVDPIVNGNQLVWSIANVATTPIYVMSTHDPASPQFDAGCQTPFGGFIHLGEFGIPLQPAVNGNGRTWLVNQFTGSSIPWSFFGKDYASMAFTDDALLSVAGFDPSLNSGINAPIPTAALPNNLLAPYWADFKVVYDAAAGTGVRVAAILGGATTIIEYDGLQRADGQAGNFDVEVVMSRQPDPDGPEIMFAYDNITGTLPASVVGLEDATGTHGVAYPDAISDGLFVCYDWKADVQTLSYQTQVASDAPLNGVLTTVVASSLSAPETGIVQTSHDLFVTGVVLSTHMQAPAQVAPGFPISYTITVSNTGHTSAQNVGVVAQIPAGATYVAGGTYQDGFVRFTIPSLAAGAQTAVVFSVQMQTAANTLSAANVEVPSIVGGKEAAPGAWPWQVALLSNRYNQQFCGGSLIARNWVLTAAHCVNDALPGNLSVVVGRHDLSTSEGQRIQVNQILVHPDYNVAADGDADIALLRLTQPAVLTTTVQLVPLTGPLDAAAYAPGTPATVTGWGTRKWGEADYPDKLYQVTVPIVDQAACVFAYGSLAWEITDNMICAGLSEGGKDACQGDSGGPLVVPVGTGWKQVGIVSTGQECAMPVYAGIYTRVPNFITWIDDQESTLRSGSFLAADGSGLPGHSTVGANSVTTLVRQMQMLLPTIRR